MHVANTVSYVMANVDKRRNDVTTWEWHGKLSPNKKASAVLLANRSMEFC